MKYRKLLELYKAGQLTEAQSRTIEDDIEKQEAISEYLAEAEEALEIELPEISEDSSAADFAKEIQRSIRKAFLKLGIVILSLTLIITLFIQFALPDIVSSFYYQPDQIIGKTEFSETNRISSDIAVYTELAIPGYQRDTVRVTDRGYGNYDITINQTSTLTNRFSDLSGKIEKGKLTLYSNSFLRPPAVNTFGWFDANRTDESSKFSAKKKLSEILPAADVKNDRSISRDEVSKMNSGDLYLAYITLDRQMPYEDFIRWTTEHISYTGNLWCAPRTSGSDYPANLGFYYNPSSSQDLSWDHKAYPNLFTWDTGSDMTDTDVDALRDKMGTEDFMKTHFTSMLRYIADNDEFRGLLDSASLEISTDCNQAAEYVEKNGLLIYGFAAVVKKEDAQRILKADNTYSISVTELV